jgi:hypothetical protein
MACAGPSCQLALMVFRASMTAALTTLLACPYRKTRMRERLALGRLLKLPAGAGTVPCDYDRDAHRPTGHAPGDRSVASRSPGRCARAPAPTRRAPASGAAPPPASHPPSLPYFEWSYGANSSPPGSIELSGRRAPHPPSRFALRRDFVANHVSGREEIGEIGSSGWTRTSNPPVNSRMLCH